MTIRFTKPEPYRHYLNHLIALGIGIDKRRFINGYYRLQDGKAMKLIPDANCKRRVVEMPEPKNVSA